jgi:hypothetical protein
MRGHRISEAHDGVEWIHRTMNYLTAEFARFPQGNPPSAALANLGARAILFHCAQMILREHGLEITSQELMFRCK